MKRILGILVLSLLGSSPFAIAVSGPENPLKASIAGKGCDLWSDPQGVPHIRADSDLLGVSCLGYLHGRDRTWQMDFFRKTVQGKKAEFYGMEAVQSDFFMRLLDLKGIADQTFGKMAKTDQEIFWAYSYGVNQGMKEALKKGVYEFQQAGYQPEPWRPEDSIALILLQSFDQTRKSFQDQLKQESQSKRFSTIAQTLFQLDHTPWDTTILKDSEYPKNASRMAGEEKALDQSAKQGSSADLEVALASIPAIFSGLGAGSNSWVVSPEKSATGHAWMANDPHLQLTYPSFWYWAHLKTENLDAIGATLPGAPAFPSGASRYLSWGLTNSYMPVARISRVNEQELADAETHRPLIWIKFWKVKLPFFFKTFRKTAGARLPVLPLDGPEGKAMVLRWTGFDVKPEDFSALFQLLRAKSAKEADAVFARAQIPTWNFVYADVNGDIGFRVVGRVPRFEKTPPFGIPNEKLVNVDSSIAFERPLSSDEMPHSFNPERGYIATANNRQWPSDSLWSAGTTQVQSFRAFRIEELLRKTEKHSLGSLQAVQCDSQAVDARFLVPELLRLVLLNKKSTQAYRGEAERIAEVLGILASWDYSTGLGCKACGVYRRWVDRLVDDLGVTTAALFQLLRHPDKYADSGLAGDRVVQLVYRDLSLAIRDLVDNPKTPLPDWGAIHKNTFKHLAGRGFGTHHVISTPGDENSVNPGSGEWNGKIYEHTAGASQRLIVEMSNPPKVYAVVPGTAVDEASPAVLEPNSNWRRWSQCELTQQTFPLEWPLAADRAASARSLVFAD